MAEWDFSFALKPADAPKDFYKSKVAGWKKIPVPSAREWEQDRCALDVLVE